MKIAVKTIYAEVKNSCWHGQGVQLDAVGSIQEGRERLAQIIKSDHDAAEWVSSGILEALETAHSIELIRAFPFVRSKRSRTGVTTFTSILS